MATGMRNSSARCLKLRVGVLVIATSLLAACATTGSESGDARLCPSLVDYATDVRERAAGEIALLPENSAIVEMLSDYSVMREQVRACMDIPTGA